ncbi:MAG: DUF6788 family protein [Acidimicrobiales bacterium]
MPEPRLSEQRAGALERCQEAYAAAKSRIAEVGFTCEGSLVERYTCCHNPNCRCADPDRRHGPYFQLSWKEGGRTISRILSTQQAALYREWVDNRQALEAVLEEMRDLSREAAEHLAAEAGVDFVGPSRPRARRRRER